MLTPDELKQIQAVIQETSLTLEERVYRKLGGKAPIGMIRQFVNPTQPFDYHGEMIITSSGGEGSVTFTTQDKPILVDMLNLSVFATVGGMAKKVTSDLTARDIINFKMETSGEKKTFTVMELEAVQRMSDNNKWFWLIGARQTATFTMSHSIMTAANFGFPIKGYIDISGFQLYAEAYQFIQSLTNTN